MQVRSACKEGDIELGLCHARADVSSDGTGPRYQESHDFLSMMIIVAR